MQQAVARGATVAARRAAERHQGLTAWRAVAAFAVTAGTALQQAAVQAATAAAKRAVAHHQGHVARRAVAAIGIAVADEADEQRATTSYYEQREQVEDEGVNHEDRHVGPAREGGVDRAEDRVEQVPVVVSHTLPLLSPSEQRSAAIKGAWRGEPSPPSPPSLEQTRSTPSIELPTLPPDERSTTIMAWRGAPSSSMPPQLEQTCSEPSCKLSTLPPDERPSAIKGEWRGARSSPSPLQSMGKQSSESPSSSPCA